MFAKCVKGPWFVAALQNQHDELRNWSRGVLRGVNEDLSRLVLEARGGEGQAASPERAIDLIVRAVVFAAQNSPRVLDSDTCPCHIRIYARAWKMGRIQLLLHALVGIESSSDGDENDHEDNADQLGIAIAAIEKARRVLRAPGVYPNGQYYRYSDFTLSDPQPLSVTTIVSNTMPVPVQWRFSSPGKRRRPRARSEEGTESPVALNSRSPDERDARQPLSDATVTSATGSDPSNSVKTHASQVLQTWQDWRDEWSKRTTTGNWSNSANYDVFPIVLVSAKNLVDCLNAIARQAAEGSDLESVFPNGSYDGLRPKIRMAIDEIRSDLHILSSVNGVRVSAWGVRKGAGFKRRNPVGVTDADGSRQTLRAG
jgi:hypothetical protein